MSETGTTIHVCSLSGVTEALAASKATHIVSAINQQMMIDTPDGIDPRRHLKLAMNDISAPMGGLVAPSDSHVSRLIRFLDEWNGSSALLIHCWAGVSRSTASAYVALCRFNPRASEAELAGYLRSRAPWAYPNRLIVSHADALMEREGRMIRAVEDIGRGELVSEGRAFSMVLRPLLPTEP